MILRIYETHGKPGVDFTETVEADHNKGFMHNTSRCAMKALLRSLMDE